MDDLAATKEIAKTVGKGIDSVRDLGGFFKLILGDSLIELGQMAKDYAISFRYKNLLRIQDKIAVLHKERKLQGKTIPIPPGYALPLIENAAMEDDDFLQNLWAKLIVNATDPQSNLNLKKVYLEILASMEPIDALIIIYLTRQGWNVMREAPGGGITLEKLMSELNQSADELVFSLQNLNRLGCLIAECEPDLYKLGQLSFGSLVKKKGTTFMLSSLGGSLAKACIA